MSAAAVLAIVVAVGEAHSLPSVALLAAVEESLGSSTSTRLVELAAPTEANAIRIERELGASASAVVLWKEAARLHATLLLHVARADRWIVRSMTFHSGDTLFERGRTVGLAVASMMPQRPRAPISAPAEPSAPSPPGPAPSLSSWPLQKPPTTERPTAPEKALAPQKRLAPEKPLASEESLVPQKALRPQISPTPAAKDSPEGEKPVRAPPPVVDSVRVEAPAVPSVPHRLQIGMGALAAVGVGGSAQGAGGRLDAVWFWTQRWAVRGGLGIRTGPIPALPGSDLVSAVEVGLEWWPLGDPQRGTSSLGIRAGLLLLDHRVSFTGDSPEAQHSFLPGAEFTAQFLVGITPRWSLVGYLGLEGAMGPTDLRKGDPLLVVARIPMLRLVGGLGLRVGL